MDRTGDYQVLDPLEAPGVDSCGVPSVEAFLACLEASRVLNSVHTHRVLIVSHQGACRSACHIVLGAQKIECLDAAAVAEVEDCLRRSPCDLIVIDADLPQGDGLTLCRRLRRVPLFAHLKLVLLASGDVAEMDPIADCRFHIADWEDHSALANLQSAISNLLRLKEAEDRADSMANHLLHTNQQLEQAARQRDSSLYQAQDVLIFDQTID